MLGPVQECGHLTLKVGRPSFLTTSGVNQNGGRKTTFEVGRVKPRSEQADKVPPGNLSWGSSSSGVGDQV